jgi:hypothetical protein
MWPYDEEDVQWLNREDDQSDAETDESRPGEEFIPC